jgi:hypothetical protein
MTLQRIDFRVADVREFKGCIDVARAPLIVGIGAQPVDADARCCT